MYILTGLTGNFTEGEFIQLTTLGKTTISEAEYYDILERKTAYLFSACCEIGAILGNAPNDWQVALRNFGMNLGTAFQLADDLLDFTAEEEVLGKASGADLLEGKLTMPLILLVKKEPLVKGDLEKIIHDGDYRSYSRQRLLEKLETNGTLEETRQTAYGYAARAIKNLELLPKSEYRSALEAIPNYMIERSN